MRLQATGKRNILLAGLAAGHSRHVIQDRQSAIEAFSQLGDFLNMPVETYSAGMRMRLSFAIATAFSPEILILDEWLSAGDATFKQKAAKRMSTFVDDAGILILASHSISLLKNNCNKGLWIHQGSVKVFDEIEMVIQAYQEHNAAQ